MIPAFADPLRAPLSYGYGRGRVPVLELIVPMCCVKCQEKVRENMLELRGVQSVLADLQSQRVVVTGFVDPMKVLKKAKRVKRDSSFLSTGVSGYGHGGVDYVTSKYRRSALEYRPSLYQTPSYERRFPVAPMYRSSSLEYRPSVYRTSFNQFIPAPVFESSFVHPGYSQVITNPHYVKHIESEYY